jgi:hypothetical protein
VSSFGTLLTPYDVEAAVLAFIEKWVPTYLSEVERQTNTPTREIQRPNTYRLSRSLGDNWPEDDLPAVLLNGTPGAAETSANGVGYWFDFDVDVYADGLDEDDARRIAQYLLTAIQALLVQNGSMDGLSEGTYPASMAFPDMEDYARTQARGTFSFRAFIPSIVDPTSGPITPDPPDDPDSPPGDHPTVERVDVSVEGLAPDA